jgi:hypothetical protein
MALKSAGKKATTQPRAVKKARRSPEAETLRAENAELKRRLAETQLHRQLLIEALHGFSKQTVHARLSSLDSKVLVSDPVLQWVISTIEKLTASRPVEGDRTLGDLRVPIPRLVKLINERWFQGGGGFTDLKPATTVGDLAEAIDRASRS